MPTPVSATSRATPIGSGRTTMASVPGCGHRVACVDGEVDDHALELPAVEQHRIELAV